MNTRYLVRPLLPTVPREVPPFAPLPADGLIVQASQYYDRLAIAGDVEIVPIASAEPVEAAPDKKTRAKQ